MSVRMKWSAESRSMLKPWRMLLCLIVLSLAAGCASGEGSNSDSMTLNVGQISDSLGFFPLYVAEQEGYFEDEGLTLGDRPRLGTGARLSAALTSGSVDVAAGVMTDPLTLAESGRSAKAIGSLTNGYYIDVIASNEMLESSGVTPESPLEEKVAALEGKRIGITGPGSGTEALVVYLLQEQGIDPRRDVELVNLGSNVPAVTAAMRTGRVDALAFFLPVGQSIEEQGTGEILISPLRGDVPSLEGQTHGVVFTSQDVMEAKPEALRAFVSAIGRAERLIREDPNRARELMGGYQDSLPPRTLDAAYDALEPAIPENPRIEQAGYETAVTFHEEAGLIDQAPGYETMIVNRFAD